MKSLFDPETCLEVKERINAISEDKSPKWGKMNSGQMFKHCTTPFLIENGTVKLNTKMGFLKKIVFKMFKPMMYNDKLYRHNSPTAREFLVNYPVDYENEKNTLLNLIDEFHRKKDLTQLDPHPLFGNFTMKQWGQLQFKHLDHHLTQFGV